MCAEEPARTFSETLAATPPNVLGWRLAAVGWAVVIAWLSTERFGAEFSRPAEAGFLRLLHIPIPMGLFLALHSISRKLAHLIEYGLFCFILYRSFGNQGWFHWRPQIAFWSILTTGAYSLTDEFHQLFVPGRGASAVDCAIDTLGATSAMLLIYVCSRARGHDSRTQT